ncbi:MAG: helix-turn-helix transcriptional regulator [Pyrinomonadaceae bacterium]
MRTKKTNKSENPTGKLLKYWRNVRRKSQLDLALDAEISQRHLSFIESGRSNPSREMILTLAVALDVPFRERNDLLTAAGFAPVYRESGWDDAELEPARKALEMILKNQEPFPAVVMDRHWNIVMTNRTAPRFFGLFVDLSANPAGGNVLRMMFHPGGVRPFVVNWESVAKGLIRRVFRESVGNFTDRETRDLLDEILAFPGVPENWRKPDLESANLPVIPVNFRKDDLEFNFFSAVTTLGTPQDITLQEIRIESFFPADEATERLAGKILG